VPLYAVGSDEGPPPLARGPPMFCLLNGLGCGPTPARAGTTRSGFVAPEPHGAHPRSRGDHAPGRLPRPGRRGPPPLARGPRRCSPRSTSAPRPTPARAGTTQQAKGAYFRGKAHPRSRGDHRAVLARLSDDRGPPPLARGPPRHVARRRRLERPTPARAGTTGTSTAGRSRGRPTPARAGTTMKRDWKVIYPWAHPRSRGDHAACSASRTACTGPPPLARGPQELKTNQP